MERFRWEGIGNRIVLKQDFSDLNNIEVKKYIKKAENMIKNRGVKNIIVLANVKNINIDKYTLKIIENSYCQNKGYIERVIIYGLENNIQIKQKFSKELIDKKIDVFKKENEAMQWINNIK